MMIIRNHIAITLSRDELIEIILDVDDADARGEELARLYPFANLIDFLSEDDRTLLDSRRRERTRRAQSDRAIAAE